MPLGLEYLSESFCAYLLDVYLSACKRITLDDHYFIVIFVIKVGQKLDLSVWLTIFQ